MISFLKFQNKNHKKHYNYKILYKNGHESTGSINAYNISDVKDVFLSHNVAVVDNNGTLLYFNEQEILELYIWEEE